MTDYFQLSAPSINLPMHRRYPAIPQALFHHALPKQQAHTVSVRELTKL